MAENSVLKVQSQDQLWITYLFIYLKSKEKIIVTYKYLTATQNIIQITGATGVNSVTCLVWFTYPA